MLKTIYKKQNLQNLKVRKFLEQIFVLIIAYQSRSHIKEPKELC